MKFRPCIDIHNGKVKQIVGGTLRDEGDQANENFVSEHDAAWFAGFYRDLGLSGGHIILLNAADSPWYEETKAQAFSALSACPGLWQVGGGVNADNAGAFLDAGATHVIVTSYVFSGGQICREHLEGLSKAVGPKHVVLDLSCRKRGDAWYIVTDRWQKFTDVQLTPAVLEDLGRFCDEFLVHAADVEGQCRGIEEQVVSLLGSFTDRPVTYAGGVSSMEDLVRLRTLGQGHVDVTVGSALDLFGGTLKLEEVLKMCEKC